MHAPIPERAGFVCAATGKRFVAECKASIASLRATHGDVSIEVYTDAPDEFPGIGHLIENPVFGFADKLVAMQRCSFERWIYIDTDATVLGDLTPIFAVLDRYDIALTHAPMRFNHPTYELSLGARTLPQFGAGFLAMKNNPRFMAQWRANDELVIPRAKEFYVNGPKTTEFRANDQISLRQTLIEMWDEITIFTLPGEYNVRPFGTFSGMPQVLHDRGFQRLTPAKKARLLKDIFPPSRAEEGSGAVMYLRGPKVVAGFLKRATLSALANSGTIMARLR